jgi:uncharacterized protein YhhL (DUF1145 family)
MMADSGYGLALMMLYMSALFNIIMPFSPLGILLEKRPRARIAILFIHLLLASLLFALATESASAQFGGLSRVLYVGLSAFFMYHSVNAFVDWVEYGKNRVRVDDKAVWVAGLDVRISWEQLLDVEVEPTGLKFTTSLARIYWYAEMPAAEAAVAFRRVTTHPNYRKLDPYVNVN